jgi:hypothetical protein
MNAEFKRMMELAGLTEIKVTNPSFLNLEKFKDINTLKELEKVLRSMFPKSTITLEDEAETEDDEEAYNIVIDDLDIAPGAYQLWDTYDNPTGEEKSFMNTPDLLKYLIDKKR